ncbi:MAG: hypothetical protein ER33_15980, partial [Cyanobium sp. CACIAM 14]
MGRTIRYFATNRDRERLGNRFQEKERIRLQDGGYHWVDTDRCMAQYLGSTDPTFIPLEAVIQDSQQEVLAEMLADPSIRQVVIGIHGFNVPLHGAITSFSLLAEAVQQEVARQGGLLVMTPEEFGMAAGREKIVFIGFSWPSDGSLLAYQSDRNEATQSTAALANLIGLIRSRNPSTKVSVIAHSMGNYLTCTMLSDLVNKLHWPRQAYEQTPIGEALRKRLERRRKNDRGELIQEDDDSFLDLYIMLAPDVERREVTQCGKVELQDGRVAITGQLEYNGPFYGGLKHLVGHTHLFYSRHDSALKASVLEKEALREPLSKLKERLTGPDLERRWESSLGLNPLPSLAPPNMTGHNATLLTNRPIDHGDYFDAPQIIRAIARILLVCRP